MLFISHHSKIYMPIPFFSSIYFSGVDLEKINDCVGDPDADVENRVLKAEQDLQVSFLKCKKTKTITVFFFVHFFRSLCCFMIVLHFVPTLVSDWQRVSG